MRGKNKESTWSTCCVLLSELVSLLQLVKPPLIYVLRGHDTFGHLRTCYSMLSVANQTNVHALAQHENSIA